MKSDIFFFVTTILAVLIGICVIWALVYIIGIVKTAKQISQRAQQLMNATSDDIDQFRTNIKEKGVSWTNLAGMFMGKKKPAPKTKKSEPK